MHDYDYQKHRQGLLRVKKQIDFLINEKTLPHSYQSQQKQVLFIPEYLNSLPKELPIFSSLPVFFHHKQKYYFTLYLLSKNHHNQTLFNDDINLFQIPINWFFSNIY
jgi:hypothetical protein